MDLVDELKQIPAALIDLIACYETKSFDNLPQPHHVLLSGMGASYHAAQIGAFMLQHFGISSQAIESSDILFSNNYNFQTCRPVIYLSQSGESGEVKPTLAKIADRQSIIAITNDDTSLLAQYAAHIFPMCAGDERWIAGKTYINTLAALWVLANVWSGRSQRAALDELRPLAAHITALQAQSEATTAHLEAIFSSAERVVFLGHGPHAVTAREASMTLAEWPKLISQSYGVATFRHGFIETVDERTAVLLFAPAGRTQASTHALAESLIGYGANVWLIENGLLRCFGADMQPGITQNELLSPLLDIIPIQCFAEAAARKRSPQPGFRYLNKVVTVI